MRHQRLGVPLHADDEAVALDRLDRAVVGAARRRAGRRRRWSTAWWWKEFTRERAGAGDPVQARARLDLDLVRRLGRRLGLAVARDVLVQRPAAGDVERLASRGRSRGSAGRAAGPSAPGRARTRPGSARSARARRGAPARRRRPGRGPGRRRGRGRRGARAAGRGGRCRRAAAPPGSRRRRRACADTSSPAPSRGGRARRGGASSPAALGRSSEVVTPMRGRMPRSSAELATFRTHRWSKFAGLRFATTVGF